VGELMDNAKKIGLAADAVILACALLKKRLTIAAE
jgi:hypothetical protein